MEPVDVDSRVLLGDGLTTVVDVTPELWHRDCAGAYPVADSDRRVDCAVAGCDRRDVTIGEPKLLSIVVVECCAMVDWVGETCESKGALFAVVLWRERFFSAGRRRRWTCGLWFGLVRG